MGLMKIPASGRGEPSKDAKVDEMLADPAAYFTKAREAAKREARTYVATRERRPRIA